MNIVEKKDIKKIINNKSKYQKVMLIHDDSVSNIEIASIYDEIKDLCIFNKIDISIEKDIYEKVNDGFRTLIFMCSVNNFLSLGINREDFINIYLPTENSILPFYLDKNFELHDNCDYLILNTSLVDVSSLTSLYFNKFYNYLRNLLIMKPNEYEFNFSNEITTRVVLDGLNELKDSDFSFVDVELLTNCNISYSKLPLVDFVLISALLVLVKSIKTQSLSLVDVYKSAGEDYALIDKFYAMYNNELLISLINLNYYYLSTAVDKTKEKLLDILSVTYQYNQQEIDDIVERIKQYSKQDKGILGYLYLYNIFSV